MKRVLQILPKPPHLAPKYAEQFKDNSVVEAYRYRPPYPAETFEILRGLLSGPPPYRVLDAGCGTGALARHLADFVDNVDAVDFSRAMIEAGKKLPGGDGPALNWICGPVESAPLSPPYNLVTAGMSLHWLDWAVVLPRFAEILVPGGYLAIVNNNFFPGPWSEALVPILRRYSTNRDHVAYNLIEEIEKRGLFEKVGERRTAPIAFRQTIAAAIEGIHSSNGFSRERMTPEAAAGFDAETRELLARYADGEDIEQEIEATVVWGVPRSVE